MHSTIFTHQIVCTSPTPHCAPPPSYTPTSSPTQPPKFRHYQSFICLHAITLTHPPARIASSSPTLTTSSYVICWRHATIYRQYHVQRNLRLISYSLLNYCSWKCARPSGGHVMRLNPFMRLSIWFAIVFVKRQEARPPLMPQPANGSALSLWRHGMHGFSNIYGFATGRSFRSVFQDTSDKLSSGDFRHKIAGD